MNAQEIYDKVAVHLLTQNAKSMTGELSAFGKPLCAYRSPEGLSCAAGCLLTDEEAKGLDNNRGTAWTAVKLWSTVDVSRYDEHTDLIQELQTVHDHTEVDQWGIELAKLAEKHNLSTAVLR